MYALSLLAFSAVSVVGLYLLQRLQGELPLNPTDVGGVPAALAFNTAASFVTNTNWQNYARRVDDEPSDADGRSRPCRTSCLRPSASPSRSR